MGRRAFAELFHHSGNDSAVFAFLDAAERAAINAHCLRIAAFRFASAFARCGRVADNHARCLAFALKDFRLANQIAVIINHHGADNHHAGQGVSFAVGFAR